MHCSTLDIKIDFVSSSSKGLCTVLIFIDGLILKSVAADLLVWCKDC